MLKSSATADGNKSVDYSTPKSPSSLDTAPSSKKASTTVEDDSKQGESPSCCTTSRAAPTFCTNQASHIVDAVSPKPSAELLSREGVMLLPQHAEELLYDPDRCSCDLEWRCVPHDACFIHDSCFCEGSGSFPPVKPQRPSWAQFSYDWYCELAASLALHPHSPLPRFGSEVEPHVMFFSLSDPHS